MNCLTFGYVGDPTEKSVKMKRFFWFKETLEQDKKTINLNLIINKYDSTEPYKTMSEYIKNNNDAVNTHTIFCGTDTIAIGVIDTLRYLFISKNSRRRF